MVRSSEVICITCNTNLVTGKIIPAETALHIPRIPPQSKRIALFVGIGLLIFLVVAAVWVLT